MKQTNFNKQTTQDPVNANPLGKYFRHPKIYITLAEEFYEEGSLEHTTSHEYPIYSMTAKDEITMKGPDALLNGEAVRELIESCCPNIKNAWKVPSVDIDKLLIAIRFATYGEYMDRTLKIPNTEEEREFRIDLKHLMASFENKAFDTLVEITDELSAVIRPLTYEEFNSIQMKTFEEQKILKVINDDSIPDDLKLSEFNKSFKKLTQITIESVLYSIVKIVTPETEVTNKEYIVDFIQNADKDFYQKIIHHLEQQKLKFQIKPIVIQTTPEEQQAGAPETFEFPLMFSESDFFA